MRKRLVVFAFLLLLAFGAGCASNAIFETEFLRFKKATDCFCEPREEEKASARKAMEFFLEEAGPRGVRFLFEKMDTTYWNRYRALKLLWNYLYPPFSVIDSEDKEFNVRDQERCGELIRKGLEARSHMLFPELPFEDDGYVTGWARKEFVELAYAAKATGLAEDMLKVLRSDPSTLVRHEAAWFFHECYEEIPSELKGEIIEEMLSTCINEPDPEYAFKAGNLCLHKAGLSAVPYIVRILLDPELSKNRINSILMALQYQARESKDRSWLQVLVFLMTEVEPAAIATITQMEQLVLEEDRQKIPAATAAPPDKLTANWTTWWQMNGRYLYWDAWKERFSINEDAKKNGSPVNSATGEPLQSEELKKAGLKEKELSSVLEKALKQWKAWYEKNRNK